MRTTWCAAVAAAVVAFGGTEIAAAGVDRQDDVRRAIVSSVQARLGPKAEVFVDGLGSVAAGFLEDSNVSVVEEMVNMILGQRAYEANSRVIRAADEMLQQVNNLSR